MLKKLRELLEWIFHAMDVYAFIELVINFLHYIIQKHS